jgi:hypothetical protein
MNLAILKRVPEPINTAEKAQMPKIKDRKISLNMYLSKILRYILPLLT